MKNVMVYHYDSFSKEPNKGNPAGVVLSGEDLTEQEMQVVASKVGFSETAFVLRSDTAAFRFRFFTPGQELNLCGHGTIAAIHTLKSKGLLGDRKELTIETKAGILPIKLEMIHNSELFITMKHATPQFRDFKGSIPALAKSIGLDNTEIDNNLPILYGSTGSWTLLVPIKSLCSFNKMKPENHLFPTILKEMPNSSVHPFCLETYDPKSDMHGRHFSAPLSGTIEDPVTGTASGVMGAYYERYINQHNEPFNLIIEQGQEMGKDGRVMVRVDRAANGEEQIEISGSAVFVTQFNISI